MSSHVFNSQHINVPVETVWKMIRAFNFIWNGNVKNTYDVVEGKDGKESFNQNLNVPAVGSLRVIVYNDGTEQRVRVTEVSDQRRTLAWEVVSSNVPLTYSGATHTVTLRPITANNSTYIEWTTDFSRDVSAEALADAKYKQLENFRAIEQEAPLEFNFFSTADQVVAKVDLSGKTIVVTGSNAGLGFESARAFVSRGAHVIACCRDEKKAQATATALSAHAKMGGKVTGMVCDLTNLVSVRAFAQQYIKTGLPINVLLLNAGVMACPHTHTEQKLEMQIGTNHIAHFYLTKLLLPTIKKSAPARVVVVSSSAHRLGNPNFDDINFAKTPYNKWQAYGASKCANILFASHLNSLLKQEGINNIPVNALHPGVIFTELQRHIDNDEVLSTKLRMKSVQQGAATQVLASVAPQFASNDQGGKYLDDCKVAPTLTAFSRDPQNALKLWELSEKIVAEFEAAHK